MKSLTSAISYAWNWLCGLLAGFGAISPDGWMVIISAVGMVITAYTNWHFKNKEFKAEFGDGANQ